MFVLQGKYVILSFKLILRRYAVTEDGRHLALTTDWVLSWDRGPGTSHTDGGLRMIVKINKIIIGFRLGPAGYDVRLLRKS